MIPQHQFSLMNQDQGFTVRNVVDAVWDWGCVFEQCQDVRIWTWSWMILWSVTAQSYKSSKRTRLEACFKSEWRQQPREEGMRLFFFLPMWKFHSNSSRRATLTLTSCHLSVLLVGWRGLPQGLFKELLQARCQIKTFTNITMPLWSSSPILRRKSSAQRAQRDRAFPSGLGLVSWDF